MWIAINVLYFDGFLYKLELYFIKVELQAGIKKDNAVM